MLCMPTGSSLPAQGRTGDVETDICREKIPARHAGIISGPMREALVDLGDDRDTPGPACAQQVARNEVDLENWGMGGLSVEEHRTCKPKD
jgi:hypothetical protein